jgi:hypothetical protein
MPAFAARAHRRALTRALEACGRGDGVPELTDALVGAFAAVTDVDGACFHVADPASGLPTSSVRRGAPPGDFERSLEYEYRRPDVATFAELARRRVPVAARSRETAGAPQCSARFREMLAPEGCVDELRAVFADAFGIWGYLTLFGRRRFAEDDLELAASLVPRAAAALRRLRAAGLAPPRLDARPAVIVVEASGEVAAADPRALKRHMRLPTARCLDWSTSSAVWRPPTPPLPRRLERRTATGVGGWSMPHRWTRGRWPSSSSPRRTAPCSTCSCAPTA